MSEHLFVLLFLEGGVGRGLMALSGEDAKLVLPGGGEPGGSQRLQRGEGGFPVALLQGAVGALERARAHGAGADHQIQPTGQEEAREDGDTGDGDVKPHANDVRGPYQPERKSRIFTQTLACASGW